jgi:hypothetical protein
VSQATASPARSPPDSHLGLLPDVRFCREAGGCAHREPNLLRGPIWTFRLALHPRRPSALWSGAVKCAAVRCGVTRCGAAYRTARIKADGRTRASTRSPSCSLSRDATKSLTARSLLRGSCSGE